MPDLQNFSVTRTAPGNLNCPRHTVEGRLVEGADVIADFTGANAIRWPDVLATLSQSQQDDVVNAIAQTLITMKAGG